MVFSSIPAYLDPSNWQQPQNHQIFGNTSGGPNPLLQPPAQPVGPLLPPPPPPPPPPPHGSIRPGSMAERARLANIPMPEAALKCPRCESTNTKFCYFNNYSLSQPRHFCKTCRRYWTRGGALRNVPVGGGCRRNKRSSKSSSCSKSPASSAADPTRQTNSSDNNNINNNNSNNNDNNSHVPSSTAISNLSPINGLGLGPLRFMPPLSHLAENFGGDHHPHQNMGLGSSYPGPGEMGFPGSLGLIGGPVLAGDMAGSSLDPWRLQQQVPNFPFFGGLEQPYQFQGGDQPNFMAVGGQTGHHHGPRPKFSGSMLSQLAAGSVKMEESQAEVNLSRQLLGGNMAAGNEQWSGNPGGASWTELSGFSTSSTSNPL